jgi:hypothetical protein
MRWPYVFCASILITGVFLASPAIIWTLAAIAGATTVGYVLGGVMVPIATLVATTHVCIPSLVYKLLFGPKQSTETPLSPLEPF